MNINAIMALVTRHLEPAVTNALMHCEKGSEFEKSLIELQQLIIKSKEFTQAINNSASYYNLGKLFVPLQGLFIAWQLPTEINNEVELTFHKAYLKFLESILWADDKKQNKNPDFPFYDTNASFFTFNPTIDALFVQAAHTLNINPERHVKDVIIQEQEIVLTGLGKLYRSSQEKVLFSHDLALYELFIAQTITIDLIQIETVNNALTENIPKLKEKIKSIKAELQVFVDNPGNIEYKELVDKAKKTIESLSKEEETVNKVEKAFIAIKDEKETQQLQKQQEEEGKRQQLLKQQQEEEEEKEEEEEEEEEEEKEQQQPQTQQLDEKKDKKTLQQIVSSGKKTYNNNFWGDSRRKLAGRNLDILLKEKFGSIHPKKIDKLYFYQKDEQPNSPTKILFLTTHIKPGNFGTLQEVVAHFKSRPNDITANEIECAIPLTDSENVGHITGTGHIKTLHLKIKYDNKGQANFATAVYFDPKFKVKSFSSNNNEAYNIVKNALNLNDSQLDWQNKTPDLFIGPQQLPFNFSDCGFYAFEQCSNIFEGNPTEYSLNEEERRLHFIRMKINSYQTKEYGVDPNDYQLFTNAADNLYRAIINEQNTFKKNAALNILYEIMFLPREHERTQLASSKKTTILGEDDDEFDDGADDNIDNSNIPNTETDQTKRIKATLTLLNNTATAAQIQNFITDSHQFVNSFWRKLAFYMLCLASLSLFSLVGISLYVLLTTTVVETLPLPILGYMGATIEISSKAWSIYYTGVSVMSVSAATLAPVSYYKVYDKPEHRTAVAMQELANNTTPAP